MTFETDFDRISMFAPSDWGVIATYKNRRSRYPIKGIFDNQYELVDVAEVGFSSSTPIFTIPTSALPCKPVIGDLLTIDCETYTVRNFRADGTGVTILTLEVDTDLAVPVDAFFRIKTATNGQYTVSENIYTSTDAVYDVPEYVLDSTDVSYTPV